MALVVGVGGYRNVPALTNPPNDARDIAAALGRLGFETETLIDPDRLALEAGARRLGQRARGADAALFFFAGHALEASGRNWLLPAPADIRSDRDLRFEALDLDGVLEQLEGAARLSILILDACRDNPFRRRLQSTSRSVTAAPGLGQVNAAVGTLLAFATAPGTVADDGRGRNSPFTTALLRRIETPGLEVRQLMAEVRREVREATQGRQVPWENSALEGSFHFRAAPPPPPSPPPSAAAPPPAAAAPAAETVFWESMRASRNPADFRAYLARFPDGVFVPLARNRLEELEGRRPAPGTRAPDPTAVLDPATPEGREALLQRALSLVQPISPGRLETHVQSLRAFRESPQHRAFAVAPGRQTSFRVSGAASAAAAEELVLERCQLRNGEPCILVALNDTIRVPPRGAEWPRREMERSRYEGAYRPDRIPALTAERRRESDLAGYGRAREPKAMAIHPLGRVFMVTAAQSRFAAEAQALRVCNEDPVRAGASGPCFLYAVGNRVALAGRHTEPLASDPAAPARPPAAQQATASVPAPAPPPAPAPAPAPASAATAQPQPAAPPPPDPRAALHAEMVAAVPFLPRALAEAGLRDYFADRTNRAFAVAPEAGSYWRIGGLGAPALAEERALEGCQLRYGVACVLIAVNDEIRRPAAGTDWPRRDMPRFAAAEAFDVQRIPVLSAATRAHPLATGYAAAAEPKAMAIHPWGRFFVSSGASSQEVAEAAALAACNGDADRNGRDGPCLLYAVGNRVVLAARRTQATLAPAAAAPP
ncbi:caspase family protein, partial [Plastoroseomonas hellenica]|uniref:caspase family protein n=1 Tax=Plastoroseomonas hellenica TaxID=2687306 RepID=UPI001BACF8E3|nr:caspase family protein [Plastoroseomonas hellenica]